jgi:hypothetical protein
MSLPVRRIETLERRAHYLKTKIFNSSMSLAKIDSVTTDYDKAELAALEWAIPILKRVSLPSHGEQKSVSNQ